MLTNFGGNITINPATVHTPQDESELIDILNRHQGQRIRCLGRRHSCSRLLEADEVLLDLSRLNEVHCSIENGTPVVHAGAGCQIWRLLSELDRQQGWTLPSVGFITEQSLAGAISTGTHGSGRHSLSHYVLQVRVARYDRATGAAKIETICDGEELQALRCSLGCLGIIVRVTMQCRSAYRVEESFHESRSLDEVLQAEVTYPLQQFYLLPWRWTFIAQRRRETEASSSWSLWWYLWYRLFVFDIAMRLLVLAAVRIVRRPGFIRMSYRWLIPACVIRDRPVTGPAVRQLVMEHELFRHVEIELFVQRSRLAGSLEFLQDVLSAAGTGTGSALAKRRFQQQLEQSACVEAFQDLRATFCHHFPICVRKILPDETLISMASNAGNGSDASATSDDSSSENAAWYAITLTSYDQQSNRESFCRLAQFLAISMARLFGARPHWGKLCPLPSEVIRDLYPAFGRFQQLCQEADPEGVFRNAWTRELLNAPQTGNTTEKFSQI